MIPGTDKEIARPRPLPPVLLASNSFWNIANFRGRLVEALVKEGYEVLIAAPEEGRAWARSRGARSIAIAIDRSGLNPFTDARLWLDYVNLMRRTKPRFFLGFTIKPNIYGSLAAQISRVASLPNVSGLGTAFMSDGPLSRFAAMLCRLAFRRCPIVFFQNPDDRDLFLARGIVRSGQAQLLPGSGIDLDHFAPAAPPMDDEPRFLFIGRLMRDKGVGDFVEAARELRAEHPHWRFQLLGELDPGNRSGIAPSELRQWIDEGVVEHLGQVDDVRPHIAAATAVVLPSYREGLPNSLLEGAAMARPLIATDVPGSRQLVEHGVTGLLCEVRNPTSLAEAMRRMGELPAANRMEMGRAGRALVERDYDVKLVVRAYLDALAQLAAAARV